MLNYLSLLCHLRDVCDHLGNLTCIARVFHLGKKRFTLTLMVCLVKISPSWETPDTVLKCGKKEQYGFLYSNYVSWFTPNSPSWHLLSWCSCCYSLPPHPQRSYVHPSFRTFLIQPWPLSPLSRTVLVPIYVFLVNAWLYKGRKTKKMGQSVHPQKL